MAITPFKTFVSGEVLTASDLNSSFTQITDNGEDLAWPATKAKDFDGQSLILDSDADTTISAATDDEVLFTVGNAQVVRIGATAIGFVSASNVDDGDLLIFNFIGDNDAAEEVTYARINAEIADASDTTEDGRIVFDIMDGGTLRSILKLGAGDEVEISSNRTGAVQGPTLSLRKNDETVGPIGGVEFRAQDSADDQTVYGVIQGLINVNTDGSEDGAVRVSVIVNGSNTEIARFTASGDGVFVVGKATPDSGVTAGLELSASGQLHVTASGTPPIVLNRLTSDGDLIQLKQDGTEEGLISVSGTTVTYGTFTGAHDAQWGTDCEPDEEPAIGTLLATVDEEFEREGNSKPQLSKVMVAEHGDPGIYGVYGGARNGKVQVWALGTVMARVVGPIGRGDLIECSKTPGVGQRQGDGLVRTTTLGKATRGDDREEERLVACVLYSG